MTVICHSINAAPTPAAHTPNESLSGEEVRQNPDIHYRLASYVIQPGDTLSRIARDWGRSTQQSSKQLTYQVTQWLIDNNYQAFQTINGSELIVGETLFLPTLYDMNIKLPLETQHLVEEKINATDEFKEEKQRPIALKNISLPTEQPATYHQNKDDFLYKHEDHNPAVDNINDRVRLLWIQGLLFASVLLIIQVIYLVARFCFRLSKHFTAAS